MNPNKKEDHHFSSFAMGATVGVIAALVFGTEEGRKLIKEVLDIIPEKYKKIPEKLMPHEETHEYPPTPIITPQETSHHATYDFESPPPAPPTVHPFRPL
ncbi:MAG TPA: hypothetical protein VLH94_00660 [Spirochaetia bacterium]|nr:hypothetical protein [Spirochaetia bacterium]